MKGCKRKNKLVLRIYRLVYKSIKMPIEWRCDLMEDLVELGSDVLKLPHLHIVGNYTRRYFAITDKGYRLLVKTKMIQRDKHIEMYLK